MKQIIIPVFLALMIVQAAQAQDLNIKKKKEYFRCFVYSTDGLVHKGWLGYLTDSSLLVAKNQTFLQSETYPRDKMQSFDYSSLQQLKLRKKGSVGRGILYGSLIGVASGFIVGMAMGDDPPQTTMFKSTAAEKGAALAMVGGLGGALIGGIIGAVAHKTFIIQGKKKKLVEMKETVLERIYRN